MFRVGEKVCYPMHGVGFIEAIEEKEILGTVSNYYSVRFFSGRMTAMVPVDSAEKIGLRRLVDPGEYEKVIAFLRVEPLDEDENWNRRYRDNYEKLRGGDIYDIAEVVKCLRRRENEKGLSVGEKKMLGGARQILRDELAAATGIDSLEVERALGD